jgi:hypothetical protein
VLLPVMMGSVNWEMLCSQRVKNKCWTYFSTVGVLGPYHVLIVILAPVIVIVGTKHRLASPHKSPFTVLLITSPGVITCTLL